MCPPSLLTNKLSHVFMGKKQKKTMKIKSKPRMRKVRMKAWNSVENNAYSVIFQLISNPKPDSEYWKRLEENFRNKIISAKAVKETSKRHHSIWKISFCFRCFVSNYCSLKILALKKTGFPPIKMKHFKNQNFH